MGSFALFFNALENVTALKVYLSADRVKGCSQKGVLKNEIKLPFAALPQ